MNPFSHLSERQAEIAEKRIVVGFDGFIDTIVRPVRQTAAVDAPEMLFRTIGEFGQFLAGCAEKSCSIELKQEAKQLGGNLPYLSRSAGRLGMNVTCIGMLGADGKIEQEFQELPCRLYSFAAPGQSTCFEFQDGKIFFATDCKMTQDPWQLVLDATDSEAVRLFQNADLTAMVNWSELSFAPGLWEGVFEHALKNQSCDKKRFMFFDLCDCSRKTDREIEDVLQLMGRFSKVRTSILSVNENEAHVIADRILCCGTELGTIGKALRDEFGIDQVIIHTIRESFLVTSHGITGKPSEFVEHPKISTGAGDNFNAAFCFGTVMGLTDEDRVIFANRYASFYVSNGYSPTLEEIVTTL
ncbi:PfkB family carbohydrate kinase [Sinanaerobacter chloroacetimidivorans]|uniref:PfkB family carbohydrate kinase n=1 Tax=Sinanaerobacter chloroacetimidivorans TaxID=2818044 RepID=UPI001D045474|nr:carbohydrate kinase family protein [Sinanaerobacter chloroacetimidivorans]